MRILMLGAITCMAMGVAAHAQPPDPRLMAPINTFIESFNKGDIAAAEATHAAGADLTILDEVPPYLWRGPKAFGAWVAALDAEAKKLGQTEAKVILGKVTRVETTGSDAYVVVPATFTFKQQGVAMRERAQITVVLKQGPSGWLIHGWTWTGPRPQKAPAS